MGRDQPLSSCSYSSLLPSPSSSSSSSPGSLSSHGLGRRRVLYETALLFAVVALASMSARGPSQRHQPALMRSSPAFQKAGLGLHLRLGSRVVFRGDLCRTETGGEVRRLSSPSSNVGGRKRGGGARSTWWPRPRSAVSASINANANANPNTAAVEIPRGDAGGAVVDIQDLLVGVGDSDLVQDVNVKLMPGYRYGVVGQNGAGKSTLLRIMTGELLPVGGRVLVDYKASVGYLKQTAVSGSTRTVEEEVKSQMHEVNTARSKLEEAEEQANADPSEANLIQLEAAQSDFEQKGGYLVEGRVSRVLSGLGFKETDFTRPCTDFSGGWQMRIALARTLLSDPSLLLLDEPTNHLDASAKKWLAGYLASYQGTLVVVSHEESLLEKVCDRILEINNQRLVEFRCGLRQFKKERELLIKQQLAEYERQQMEIKKLEGFIEKFGAKATKASAAESRKKQLAKIEGSKIEVGDLLVEKKKRPVLKLPTPPANDVRVASLENASFGWSDAEPLIRGCNWTIERGERWVILGENGAGKSTLMAAMRGSLPLLDGDRYAAERTVAGVFTQDLAQDLPQDKTAIAHVLDTLQTVGGMTDEDGRRALGALGLSGPKALRRIGDLSGGEKARVALALLTLRPSNLLLLDEVTNHLDVTTVEVLSSALRSWSGSLVVITHDRDFAQRLNPTHVALVRRGGVVETHDGGLRESDFSAARGSEGSESQSGKPQTSEDVKQAKEDERKLRKAVMNAPKRISKIESLLETLDAKILEIDGSLAESASDMDAAVKLSSRRDETQAEIDKLYDEWDELEQFLAEHQDLIPMKK